MLVIAALAALLQTGPPPIAFPDEGHPFALINDLHETVYEPDFRQQRAWEESELAKNGIREAHGSVSQHELYTDRHVLLNVPLFPSKEEEGVTPRSPRT